MSVSNKHVGQTWITHEGSFDQNPPNQNLTKIVPRGRPEIGSGWCPSKFRPEMGAQGSDCDEPWRLRRATLRRSRFAACVTTGSSSAAHVVSNLGGKWALKGQISTKIGASGVLLWRDFGPPRRSGRGRPDRLGTPQVSVAACFCAGSASSSQHPSHERPCPAANGSGPPSDSNIGPKWHRSGHCLAISAEHRNNLTTLANIGKSVTQIRQT